MKHLIKWKSNNFDIFPFIDKKLLGYKIINFVNKQFLDMKEGTNYSFSYENGSFNFLENVYNGEIKFLIPCNFYKNKISYWKDIKRNITVGYSITGLFYVKNKFIKYKKIDLVENILYTPVFFDEDDIIFYDANEISVKKFNIPSIEEFKKFIENVKTKIPKGVLNKVLNNYEKIYPLIKESYG